METARTERLLAALKRELAVDWTCDGSAYVEWIELENVPHDPYLSIGMSQEGDEQVSVFEVRRVAP